MRVNRLHKSIVLFNSNSTVGLLNLFSVHFFKVTDISVKIHAYHLNLFSGIEVSLQYAPLNVLNQTPYHRIF